MFGSYDLEDDLLHGCYRRSRAGADFLGFLGELRGIYPLDERLQRSFVIAGSDHPDHDAIEQALLRYIDWRNQHRHDPKLRRAEKRGCSH